MGVKQSKSLPVTGKEKVDVQESNQTLEDLKAIDEDIEKLRKQIEERDKIISALREAAEAKDKKLDNLTVEYSKLRSNGKLDLDTSSESNCTTVSSPSSPPLCSGELCWTDNFVNKNYHAPVYAQLLNDHNALQRIYKELRAKLETKEKDFERLEEETLASQDESKTTSHDNAINLIMAEQIRMLKEREAQLVAEAEEMREQRDLMEFRILELEECRKEFLDKEGIHEGKHRREKIVWSERDIEEISDSGVMSLPTSEDLTSDSELGDTIRNYSPLGAVSNLGLLPLDNQDSGVADLKIKKSLKSSECLQESGIFEDSEQPSESAILPTKQTRGCQTDTILDKTLLEFIDSSCDLLFTRNRTCESDQKSSDDLSTEISKLSVIQKRIQQKTSAPAPKGPHTVFTCPHTNSVLFYEERLAQLEDKLRIYESSGDTKEVLLSKRLQKEIELSCRVKELTEKVTTLELINRRLEEEKCEFEEAENDTRFQCQRLEIRLQELIDKNTELEIELERQKIRMSEERRKDRKKGSLENLISRYEQRNFELEEREVEAKQRLDMIEAAMPAIVAWNMFKIVQNPDFVGLVSGSSKETEEKKTLRDQDVAMFQRLEELLDDQKKLRRDYEKVEETAADREKALRTKIEELEAKAAKDRETLEQMTNSLKVLKLESEDKGQPETSNLVRPDESDLFEELKHMVVNEIQLRTEIERLEKAEQAYMESLEKADEIWASIEADYKRRLKEAEAAGKELEKRVAQLEATQLELEMALEEGAAARVEPQMTGKNDIKAKIEILLLENEKLKSELTQSLDQKFDEQKKFLENENFTLREELKKLKEDFIQEERKYLVMQKELQQAKGEAQQEKEAADNLRKEVEERNSSVQAMELNLQNQISDLTQELSQKGKELSNLEVTVAELREEVETLENKVAELVETIRTTIANQEEAGSASSASKVVQRSLPVEEELSRHVVSCNLTTPVTSDTFREVNVRKENDSRNVQVVTSSEHSSRYLVFAASYLPRQEVKILFPHPSPIRRVQIKNVQPPSTVVLWSRNNVQSNDLDKEDEVFQLCVRNTELQQALEKMEEEGKLKEKELEELQNLAQEIRKEQINLELLYDVKSSRDHLLSSVESKTKEDDSSVCLSESQEEPRRTSSIDFLQIISPIVIKASEQNSVPLSNLQIALDNLPIKSRAKNILIKSLLDEVQNRGDTLDYEHLLNQLSLQRPTSDRKRLCYDQNDQTNDCLTDKSDETCTETNDINNNNNNQGVNIYCIYDKTVLERQSTRVVCWSG
ncbi:hypothetical protein RUM44_000639 [Polyplax serrata]|uniref:Janus kinase and microtubule-interacting protein C-terminal domain-containing protein n=1 Tax=Polyplax serrata TaxID=468196 RepID=A0ABR1B5Y8_POLSC